MKKGDRVKVKKGIMLPDYDNLSIEGWQGRIIEISDDTVDIELDSITLKNTSKDYIVESIRKGLDYTQICLDKDKVELTKPRDTYEDTILKQNEIVIKYSHISYHDNEFDEEAKRIMAVLNTDDIYDTGDESYLKYREYLKANIKKPCILTGSEDFGWEEPYLFGGWDEEEYEQLKLTRASYSDQFELIKIIDYMDDMGIFAKVKRLSDNKKFELPLWDLKVVDEKSPNYLLISDFASWMTNYR
ncbi:MAG: hypothetical protein LBI82_06095 [Dysgonamonadaceae bacterium]|jgi:hypothetical protein|nr:hypothetical protein [Dysgonamonadaceae bacterium]